MKVFVAGGAGYIGSVTTELLLDAGHDVVVFDNLERGHRAAIDQRAAFVHGDLRDAQSIMSAVRSARPDAIMHFAAYALVGESVAHPDRYFRNNVVGGLNLLDAAAAADVGKIVFSSTCAVYGEPDSIPIAETARTEPVNPYGESKLAFEKMLAWYQRLRGIKAVALRYFNAAGADPEAEIGELHFPETHLIPLVLYSAQGLKEEVKIFGTDYPTRDGTCIRDYIHVMDLADAHIKALQYLMDHERSDSFNLGSGSGYSVREVIESVKRVTRMELRVVEAERREGDPPVLISNSQKALEVLGWKPRYGDIETIIETAWKWYQKALPLQNPFSTSNKPNENDRKFNDRVNQR